MPKVDKMVDLGCAYGGVTATVAYRIKAKEVYGIDKLADRLEEAGKKGIITIEADLNKPPYICGGETFDLVRSNGVIEHLNWYDDLIEESYRLLKDGGHLVLAFPNL
jgi:SAM-dependent methyltransferase